MPVYSTASLLATIKRKAFIPSTQETFTDEDLLAIATEEMHNTLLPAILNTREEYYVVRQTIPLVSGIKNMSYDIPSRAVGMGLRELSQTVGGVERNMPRMEIEDKVYDDFSSNSCGFYIKNNTIYTFGTQDGDLNMYYYLRPGDLVKTDEATTIVSYDSDNKQIVVANVPSGWTTGTVIDVVNNKPGFDTRMISNTIASVSGTTITLSEAFPTRNNGDSLVAAGMWVTQEETSPVPQIPVEFFQYLAEAVTAYVMESQGDQDGYVRAQQRMQQMLTNAQKTISPRVDGESKKFVRRSNRGSFSYNNWRY
jgi:hypothetical protein